MGPDYQLHAVMLRPCVLYTGCACARATLAWYDGGSACTTAATSPSLEGRDDAAGPSSSFEAARPLSPFEGGLPLLPLSLHGVRASSLPLTLRPTMTVGAAWAWVQIAKIATKIATIATKPAARNPPRSHDCGGEGEAAGEGEGGGGKS